MSEYTREQRLGYALRKAQDRNKALEAKLEEATHRRANKELFANIAKSFIEAGFGWADARDYVRAVPWKQVTPESTAAYIEELERERDQRRQEDRRKNGPQLFPPTTGGIL